MNAGQARLLATTAVVALCMAPAAAHAGSTSAVVIQAQDDAAETEAPGEDDAKVTSEPIEGTDAEGEEENSRDEEGEDAQVTSDDSSDETQSDETAGDEPVEDEFDEDFDIPAGDPTFWEDVLTDEGFSTVSCAFESVNSTIFELTEEPPAGTGWLLLVALADIDEDFGIYDVFDEPHVGEAFALVDQDDVELPLSGVVLCSADLEASDGDAGVIVDELGGSGGEVIADVATPGPAVETDVPAPSKNPGPAAAGFAVALVAAAIFIGRRFDFAKN